MERKFLWKYFVEINMLYVAKDIFLGPFPQRLAGKRNPWQTSFHSMKIFFISHNTSQDIKISYCQPYILVYFTVVLIPVYFQPLAVAFTCAKIDVFIPRKNYLTLLCLYSFNYLLYCRCCWKPLISFTTIEQIC